MPEAERSDHAISQAKEVDDLIAILKASTTTAYNTDLWERVSKCLTHHRWFSPSQLDSVRTAAAGSPGLTSNQRRRVPLVVPDDDSEDYDRYDGDDSD